MCKVWLTFLFVIFATKAFPLSLEDAHKIGERIWRNECGGSKEGLTCWNEGEEFPSLGIGHFIWYAEGKQMGFEESFPSMLLFLQKKGAILPSWLKVAKASPWSSRDEFYKDIKSPKMESLRQFLYDTKDLQALFIVNRLNIVFAQIVEHCEKSKRDRITTYLHELGQNPQGLYALIDYVNFKGSGMLPSERYLGEGWGLKQVLEEMPPSSKNPLADFVEATKIVLERRVKNAPLERNERRWLKGWFNRVDTYLKSESLFQ